MSAGLRFTVALWVASALMGCRGEPKVLEPRAAPPARQSSVVLPEAPPVAGYGRVVLESTDEPLLITVRADTTFIPPGHTVPPTRTGELCATPCAVDLPVGRYKLFLNSADGSFERSDTDVLEVSPGTTYYLRAPGKHEPPEWIPVLPTVLIGVAVAAVLGGGALLAQDDDSLKVPGGALVGGGITLGILGGIWHYDASRGSIQKGATTSWKEPAQ